MQRGQRFYPKNGPQGGPGGGPRGGFIGRNAAGRAPLVKGVSFSPFAAPTRPDPRHPPVTALLTALVSLAGALGAVTAASGYSAVVYLVVCFTSAALYLLGAGAGFLGFAYLVVYVGAIAILVLFVVMLAGSRGGTPQAAGGASVSWILGLTAVTAALARGVPSALPSGAALAAEAAPLPASSTLPLLLSDTFGGGLPLTLLATVILLFAMCGAVALAKSH